MGDNQTELTVFCPGVDQCQPLWNAIIAIFSPRTAPTQVPVTGFTAAVDPAVAAERELQRAQKEREAKIRQDQSDAEKRVMKDQRLASQPRAGADQNDTSVLDQLVAQILNETNRSATATKQASTQTGTNMPDRLVDTVSGPDPLDQLVNSLQNKSAEPAPHPVADCSGLPIDDTFLRDAQTSGDKCTCWGTGTYTVRGAMNSRMLSGLDQVSGEIVNNDRNPSSTGGNLELRNLSSYHNAYFGLSGAINGKLAPRVDFDRASACTRPLVDHRKLPWMSLYDIAKN